MTPESLVLGLQGTLYSLDLNDDTRPKIEALIDSANSLITDYETIRKKVVTHLRTDPQFRAYQTYHSNKLELQGPDLEITQRIIDEYSKQGEPEDLRTFSLIQAITTDTHIVEVLGQHQANILVERISGEFSNDGSFRTTDLRQLNKFLIQDKFYAGDYRTTDQVNIDQFFDDGDELWFSRPLTHPVEVSWTDIPQEMSNLCEFISRPHECPLLAAAVGHAWFARVHPFLDGNGRTARLIANLILIRNQWPPLTVTKSNRDEYINALRTSDEAGDISLLFELFVKSMRQGLQEISDDKYWRKRYQLELSQKPLQRCSDWTELAREFVSQFRRRIADHGWSLERLSMPDSTTFELLEDEDPNASTMFGLLKHPDQRKIMLHVGFMSRELRQANFQNTSDGQHFPPSIYMRERNFFPAAEYSYVHRNSSQILIREFTFISGTRLDQQVIALYGASKTPQQMSINDFCGQYINAIEDAVFPGFDSEKVVFRELVPVISKIKEIETNGQNLSWEKVVELILIEFSTGGIQSDQLTKSGLFITEIGKLTNTIGRTQERIGRLDIPLPSLIYDVLAKNSDIELSLVHLSNEQTVPVLVRSDSTRNRKPWKP